MPDRLTQLQDTVNLVSPTSISFASSAKYFSRTFQYVFLFLSTRFDYSKRNTFATASVFSSNVRYPVNFLALNGSACSTQIKRPKKITHNYFPHSYRGTLLLHHRRHQHPWTNLFYFHRCAKDIDTLIESLPNEDSSQELQTQSLRRLEIENQEAAKHLEEVSE